MKTMPVGSKVKVYVFGEWQEGTIESVSTGSFGIVYRIARAGLGAIEAGARLVRAI